MKVEINDLEYEGLIGLQSLQAMVSEAIKLRKLKALKEGEARKAMERV